MRVYCTIIAGIVGLAIFAVVCAYVGHVYWNTDRNEPGNKPPHIILIVADDLGWNDVSFHGSNQIPTPNIDALAYNGVILNRHYVLPTGTASRTCLMTGRYAIREGMQGVPLGAGEPRGVPLNVTLMPEHMRRLGYETRLLGKWNLGYYTENHTPVRRGFDSFFGYYNGYVGYFDKTTDLQMKNGSDVIGYDLHVDGSKGLRVEFNNSGYLTDLITSEAEYIITNNGNEKPLFLEIAHLAPHATFSKFDPLEVRNSKENDKSFYYIKHERRRRYAGVIKALDESVGRVVKALSEAGMLDNSIIVFMSDNGAATLGHLANDGSNFPLRGMKSTLFEGGVRSVACIFSPLIKKSQRLSDKYLHVSDWLATFYSAAGGHLEDLGEIDGYDQWRSLVYNLPSPREHILVNVDEMAANEAAIFGRHKLVRGAADYTAGYYGDAADNSLYPEYNLTDALNSAAGQAIAGLSGLCGFLSSTPDEAKQLRDSAAVTCQHPFNYPKCQATCLFDILSDPCETLDLSKRWPDVLATLSSFIDGYRPFLVRQTNLTIDPCSFPRYFNGTWMPWRKDDANSSTIIPQSTCGDRSIDRNHANSDRVNNNRTNNQRTNQQFL